MSNNFHESHWGQCLELLSHLCQYGDDILLVTGPSGIGKTTMKQALMDVESQNFVFCDISATPDLMAEELTEQVENACDNPENKDILLLIDDAQHLPFDVIAALLQLKQKTATVTQLHIVLFATAELEQKMLRSVLKDDFFEQIHTIEIEPLTIMELEAFLMHQWRNANNNNDLQLHKSKYKKIHAASNGIPGKVLQIAKDVLSGKPTTEHAYQKLSPFTVGVTVSFGLLFCVLALIWPSADDAIITTSSAPQSLAQPLDRVALTDSDADSDSTDSAPDVEPAVVPDVMPEPAPDSIQVTPDNAPQTVPDPEPVIVPQPDTMSKQLTDDEKIARLEKKLQILQEQLANEQTARRASDLKLQKNLNKKDLKKSVSLKSKTLSFSKQEAHILSFPSDNYTLQLLGSNNEKKVQAFIRDHNLTSKAFYYKGIHKGRPWYVVVSGNYISKNKAQQAAAKLPNALKRLHPWPRQYSKVQNSIKNHVSNE